MWKCNICGSMNDDMFCEGCGAKKPEAAPVPAVNWICPGCGASNDDRFCYSCGFDSAAKKPAAPAAPTAPVAPAGWVCPVCSASNDDRFCYSCGFDSAAKKPAAHAAPVVPAAPAAPVRPAATKPVVPVIPVTPVTPAPPASAAEGSTGHIQPPGDVCAWICPVCGKTNDDRFCYGCGHDSTRDKPVNAPAASDRTAPLTVPKHSGDVDTSSVWKRPDELM